MKRKVMSVLLAASMTVSLSVPALAANYTDLNGHWAKVYMEDLAARGYLSGYGDHKMGPNDPITAGQTLAMLSRLYSPNEDTAAWIYDEYKEFITQYVPASLSWAYEELAICLAANIITKDELKDLDMAGKIQKEQLAVFTVRAMQKADVTPQTTLTFADTKDITEADRDSVALLVKEGIITGGDDNKFLPHSSVTRGVAAAIISRVLNCLKTEGRELTLKSYQGLTKTAGTVYSATSSLLQLRTDEGIIREYSIPSSAKVTVGNVSKTLSALYNGNRATVTLMNDAVVGVAVMSSSDTTWVQGSLASIYSNSGTQYIYLTNPDTGDQKKYMIPLKADVTLDGKKTDFSDLKAGEFVLLTLKDAKDPEVTALSAMKGTRDINGTITLLTFGTTVNLKLTEENGAVWYFPLDITKLPKILRGQTSINIDRLSVGDTVTVTIKAGKIEAIVTAGSSKKDTVAGELTGITTTAGGTTWIIKDDKGESRTFSVEENAGAYKGDTAIKMSDISVGDRVAVAVYNETITEITLERGTTASSKITGTVLAVDTSTKTITVLTAGKLIYISTASVESILSSSSGDSMNLSSIKTNSSLVAYGAYTNSSNFKAVAIIIED